MKSEGVTRVLRKENAWGIATRSTTFARITLKVHSSLDAVRLTTAVAKALAEVAISANIAAAYYHDPIFAPFDQAADALTCLKTLSESEQK